VSEQRALCARLAQIRKPLDLLTFLQAQDTVGPWDDCLRAYQEARQILKWVREETQALYAQTLPLYKAAKQLAQRADQTQAAKGEHFRSVSEWTPNEIARRAAYEGELKAFALQSRLLRNEIASLKCRRLARERGPEAADARATLARIELEAETARLRLVRNALLTIEGLTHTNHRPSVWWLPMLDPSGDWFRRIADTTEVYAEPLISH
jgi:hypothetical protein